MHLHHNKLRALCQNRRFFYPFRSALTPVWGDTFTLISSNVSPKRSEGGPERVFKEFRGMLREGCTCTILSCEPCVKTRDSQPFSNRNSHPFWGTNSLQFQVICPKNGGEGGSKRFLSSSEACFGRGAPS